MAFYKSITLENDDQIDSEVVLESNDYIPQKIDFLSFYQKIHESFEAKDLNALINLMNTFKIYLSAFTIDQPMDFQNLFFPILTTLCQLTGNDDAVIYSFQYISYLMKNYIQYVPVFTEPQFFDFCVQFISNSNLQIVLNCIENIESFIKLFPKARDYAIEKLTVENIKQSINFEDNTIVNEDVQIAYFSLLKAYAIFPIDESNGRSIYGICSLVLREVTDDPDGENDIRYTYLYENAILTIKNLIGNNPIILTDKSYHFFDITMNKINIFLHDRSSQLLVPALEIVQFVVSRNISPPMGFYNNFISLILHESESVQVAAFSCFSSILHNQITNGINFIMQKSFFEDIESLLKNENFHIKMKAADLACLIIEKGGSRIWNFIISKGFVHVYFRICLLDDDNLTLRVLTGLYEIYSRKPGSCFTFNDDEDIFEELISSPNEEIARIANKFVRDFKGEKKLPIRNYEAAKFEMEKKKKIRIKERSETPFRGKKRLVMWDKEGEFRRRRFGNEQPEFENQGFLDFDNQINNDDDFW